MNPPAMLPHAVIDGHLFHLALLDPSCGVPDDAWWYTCTSCGQATQGGIKGAMCHWLILHPDEEIPDQSPPQRFPPTEFSGINCLVSETVQLPLW